MKVIFDEDVPLPLARFLVGHEVWTVIGMGWASIKNGHLLRLIEEQGFEVFVTGDRRMQHQQDLLGRSFAVLVLSAINWPVVKQHRAVVTEAVDHAVPGVVVQVACGEFVRQSKRRPRRAEL